ncbi:MAG: NAD-dependent epimerase/dehydratase family protein [Patescibacteria group bacterium]
MERKDFWHGKRVLVTGGDGFLASNLVKQLLNCGACVTITVRHTRPFNMLNLIGADSAPDVEYCDLLDYYALRRICDRHQIDTMFHLAASAIVSDASNAPMSTIENNVAGTLNILEVARVNKIPRVVIASTDKSYGDHANDNLESLPYRENYALRGLDVYSASKVCVDMLSQTYSYQFKLPVVILRPCNMYGPGDLNFSRLIPRTIMCLLSDLPPHINTGNADVLREYLYIEDVVTGYLLAAEKIKSIYGENNSLMPKSGKETYGWAAYNLGSYSQAELADVSKCDKIRSVTMVIDMLRKKIKDIEPIMQEKAPNFIEIPNQYLDSSKIRALGFKPEITFAEGLDRTLAWYKENFSRLEGLAQHYIVTN